MKFKVKKDELLHALIGAKTVLGNNYPPFFELEGEPVCECQACGTGNPQLCQTRKPKPRIEKIDENAEVIPVLFNGKYHMAKDPVKVKINEIIDHLNQGK